MIDLKNIFIGYIKNYHSLNITYTHSNSTYTLKEIDYFARLGSMLGYDTFTEDTIDGKHRAMDLSWWGDYDKVKDEWLTLILHLERENTYSKAKETLIKLQKYDKKFKPVYRIGIIHVRNKSDISNLQNIAIKLFSSENVLLIYRVDKQENDSYEVYGYLMNEPDKPITAISKQIPDSGVIYMNLLYTD